MKSVSCFTKIKGFSSLSEKLIPAKLRLSETTVHPDLGKRHFVVVLPALKLLLFNIVVR